MIISLWPSQNTSLSITQAAARLHIEHWMNFMVRLQKKEKGMRSLASLRSDQVWFVRRRTVAEQLVSSR